MLDWIDTHIHLLAPEWQDPPEELYRRARAAGIAKMLMPGVRVADWPRLLRLARQLAGVYLAPGLHPVYADQWNAEAETALIEMTSDPKVVAIGEIGLDAVAGPGPEVQEAVFRAQLKIACDAGLPVLLHSRKTTGRTLAILRELQPGARIGGVWHGFSGSVQTARELVALGFKVGVGPILLRESARRLPRAVGELKAADLVLETDAPDMIAAPSGLIEVASRLAALKGWTLAETARVTGANAAALFFEKAEHLNGQV
jgi:TatD DNase family protein